MTETEVAVRLLIAWATRKADWASPVADVVADKLGRDSSLARLEAEASHSGGITEHTQVLVRLAILDATANDAGFARRLHEAVGQAQSTSNSSVISGPVYQHDVEPEDIGVIHGRFQVFHLDHLRYALAAKNLSRHLIVGVTSPDPHQAPAEAIAPHRSDPAANPLTYYERLVMISACLRDASVPCGDFTVVPFPIEQPESLANYAPRDATYYLTVNDAWGEEKIRRLHARGLRVQVLWRTKNKQISGTLVRALMTRGGNWRDLVPPATAKFADDHGLVDRMAEYGGKEQVS